MTRANINYIYQKIGHAPKTLYHYHNGDQYPCGIRDFYHVLDFTNGDWSIESFKKWLGDNYTEPRTIRMTAPKTGITVESNWNESDIPAKARIINYPCIYYDDGGFITDYSYIFDASLDKKVMVYEWADKVFEGNPEEFEKWIKKQK